MSSSWSSLLVKSSEKNGVLARWMPVKALRALPRKDRASEIAQLLSVGTAEKLKIALNYFEIDTKNSDESYAELAVRAALFAVNNESLTLFKQALQVLDRCIKPPRERGYAMGQILNGASEKLEPAYCRQLLDKCLALNDVRVRTGLITSIFPAILRLEGTKKAKDSGLLRNLSRFLLQRSDESELQTAIIDSLLRRIEDTPGASNSPHVKKFISRVRPEEKKDPARPPAIEPKPKITPARPELKAKPSGRVRVTKTVKKVRALFDFISGACKKYLADPDPVVTTLEQESATNAQNMLKAVFTSLNIPPEERSNLNLFALAVAQRVLNTSNKREAENLAKGLIDGILITKLSEQAKTRIIKAIEPILTERLGKSNRIQDKIADAYKTLKPRQTVEAPASHLLQYVGMQVVTVTTAPSKGPMVQAKAESAAELETSLLDEIVQKIISLVKSGLTPEDVENLKPEVSKLEEQKGISTIEATKLILSKIEETDKGLINQRKLNFVGLTRILTDVDIKNGLRIVDEVLNG